MSTHTHGSPLAFFTRTKGLLQLEEGGSITLSLSILSTSSSTISHCLVARRQRGCLMGFVPPVSIFVLQICGSQSLSWTSRTCLKGLSHYMRVLGDPPKMQTHASQCEKNAQKDLRSHLKDLGEDSPGWCSGGVGGGSSPSPPRV